MAMEGVEVIKSSLLYDRNDLAQIDIFLNFFRSEEPLISSFELSI